jgi:biopolymer transport protein ExbD
MDPFRLRALIAPAMSSLFLVLSLCAFVVQRPQSVGMDIPILKVWVHPYKDCDFLSDRSIVVQLRNDGSTRINQTLVSPDELRSRLAEIYESREEKIVYILSDSNISFTKFANIYNKAVSSTSDLHVVLITSQLDREFQQCPPGSYCELDWRNQTYVPCVWSNIHTVYIPHRMWH